MEIVKTALLPSEIDSVKQFLSSFDLKYESDITQTFYIGEVDNIIGTISVSDYVIKCLAVNKLSQNENIATKLVNHALTYLRSVDVYHSFVYTKIEYISLFEQLGFHLIAKSTYSAFLEFGDNIEEIIAKLRNKIQAHLAVDLDKINVGAIVANCNPVTNGHLELMEVASKDNDIVLLFILEEDKSMFTYKERFSLAYLASRHLENVIVIPSTKYIVSLATFPGYFLKEKSEEHARIDALVFNNYFMSLLNIRARYVGEETDEYMAIYNKELSTILADKLIIIPRKKQGDVVVSANMVRSLLKNQKYDEAATYLPNSSLAFTIAMAQEKTSKRCKDE